MEPSCTVETKSVNEHNKLTADLCNYVYDYLTIIRRRLSEYLE